MIKIRHTGLVTTNLRVSIDFWVKLLKFKIISDNVEQGQLIDNVLGYKKVKVRTVKLVDENKNGMLELLYYYNSPKLKKQKFYPYSTGFTHISVTVKNIDKIYKKLEMKKIKFNSKPDFSADKKVKMTYCRTPEGVFLELVQVF